MFKELDKLSEDGFLRKVISPCGKLVLYNYTDKCTYEKKWNKHTLNARGTVYEISTGRVVAKAFPKFFNFEELAVSKQRNLLKKTEFTAYEKLDGSLGIVYYFDGEWRVNTRGSFTSEQAIKAKELLDKKYDMDFVDPDYTYLVEIIYPENRIIINYGNREELVLLAIYDLDLGNEVLDLTGLYNPFKKVSEYYFKYLDEIIENQLSLGKFEEGFVVRFSDGYRVKFKSKEYLAIARIMSNMTPLNFWRNMKDGIVSKELLQDLPEEFREEIDKIVLELEENYNKVKLDIKEDFIYAVKSMGGLFGLEEDRKTLGLWLKDNSRELKYPGAMFSMLLKQNLDKHIMKEIKPKGNILDDVNI